MKKSDIIIEPATMAHAKEFYGDIPMKSFKGSVALLNGKVVGIGGLSFENETMMLFSDLKEELRPYKYVIWRAFYMLEDMVKNAEYPIVAVASQDEKDSERLLTKLEFTDSGKLTPDGSKIFWRFP